MVSNKIVAISIVAVVIVAAVGAYILLSNDSDDGFNDVTGRLQVFGNVNNDDFIDDDDIRALDSFINGTEWNQETYPYADANRDGVLDSSDRDLIQKMIDGEECTVYYYNGAGEIKTAAYPVNEVGLVGTNVFAVPLVLNVVDRVVARSTTSSFDQVFHAELIDLPSIGAKSYELSAEELSKYPQIDTILTYYTSTYDDAVETAERAGKNCIQLNTQTGSGTIQSYLLVGFLMGVSERASQVASFIDDALELVESRVATLSESDKREVLTVCTYHIAGPSYYFTHNTITAGAINPTTFSENTISLRENPEYLLSYPNAEMLLWYGGCSWEDLDEQEIADAYTYRIADFTYGVGFPESFVVLNSDLPDFMRILVAGSIIYPDLFPYEEVMDIFQDYVDRFCEFLGDYDVRTDGTWYITYDMVSDLIDY